MNTIVAFVALLFCFGIGVVAGRCWQAGKSPTPGERQEALARHVVEQQTDALTISAQDWQHAERILHEALDKQL